MITQHGGLDKRERKNRGERTRRCDQCVIYFGFFYDFFSITDLTTLVVGGGDNPRFRFHSRLPLSIYHFISFFCSIGCFHTGCFYFYFYIFIFLFHSLLPVSFVFDGHNCFIDEIRGSKFLFLCK